MYSKKEQWRIFIIVNSLLLACALLFPLYLEIAKFLPIGECSMLRFMHIYCMGCGATRSLKALLQLNILRSLKYNPIVPVGITLFAIYEFAMIRGLIRGKPRDSFLKLWMVLVFLGFWFGYAVLRNVLLFNGIDILGDVLI